MEDCRTGLYQAELLLQQKARPMELGRWFTQLVGIRNVGFFSGRGSGYDTFDQSGNVCQFVAPDGTEGSTRGVWGSSWTTVLACLSFNGAGARSNEVGFRLARSLISPIPETSTHAMSLARLAWEGSPVIQRCTLRLTGNTSVAQRCVTILLAIFPASVELAASDAAGHVDFSKIDKHVAAIQVPQDIVVAELTKKLVAPARSDIERVRAIAWWMALNIQYDHNAHRVGVAQLKAGQAPMWVLAANQPAAVLGSRKAVCMGYAKLFEACCKSIGMKAVAVGGNTRYSTEGHEWNAVWINSGWQLVDVSSMASGTGNQGAGKGQPVDFYFLPEPGQFIFSHFPGEARWQLLPKPVSRREFDSVPVVLPPLFRLGVKPEQIRQAANEGVGEFVPAAYVAKGSITLLEGPLARRLEAGKAYRFRIRAAAYAAVHMDDGGTRRTFSKQGNVFEATVTPRGPFLNIGVQKEPGGAINGTLNYVVGAGGPDRLGPEVASLINDARRQDGAGELGHDPKLDATANAHAKVMGRERATPGRAGCLVAATDNPDGKPPADFAGPLIRSMLDDQGLRAWAMARPHTRVGVGAVTADGRTYFCIEFQ